jgi:hypothetical protein
MAYESPMISEVGSVESLTLGSLRVGPVRDTFQVDIGRWHIEIPDPWGDPSHGS